MPGMTWHLVTRLATAAVAVATAVTMSACSASTAVPAPGTTQPPDIVTAPTLIASTADGNVGYREVGAGSPIMLIMGLGGSMDDWAPAFVDALAAQHTVIVFDNAGVGDTAALASPLTISAMADQASALITALGLAHPAVLGWSMGGMIAQALAVLHPRQAGLLVLAATQAGTGKSLPIPAAAAAAARSNPAAVLSVLFPPDQAAAANAYAEGILEYPGYYAASATIKTEQNAAIQQWMAGRDPAGLRLGQIRIPTLVADGTLDQLDPTPNDRLLARSVPGASLILYPDAGHAFLFQDAGAFVPAVGKFLRETRS